MKHIYTMIFALFTIIAFGQQNLVLNGTADEYTSNTGDNADAWDMTPNSTVVDNSGATIDSPYKAIWNNSTLDTWLRDTYNSGNDVDEQPGSSGVVPLDRDYACHLSVCSRCMLGSSEDCE